MMLIYNHYEIPSQAENDVNYKFMNFYGHTKVFSIAMAMQLIFASKKTKYILIYLSAILKLNWYYSLYTPIFAYFSILFSTSTSDGRSFNSA